MPPIATIVARRPACPHAGQGDAARPAVVVAAAVGRVGFIAGGRLQHGQRVALEADVLPIFEDLGLRGWVGEGACVGAFFHSRANDARVLASAPAAGALCRRPAHSPCLPPPLDAPFSLHSHQCAGWKRHRVSACIQARPAARADLNSQLAGMWSKPHPRRSRRPPPHPRLLPARYRSTHSHPRPLTSQCHPPSPTARRTRPCMPTSPGLVRALPCTSTTVCRGSRAASASSDVGSDPPGAGAEVGGAARAGVLVDE